MTCDRCRHQADVRAGKYRDAVFGRTPCSKCDWQEPCSDNTMEYDDDNTPASAHEALRPAGRAECDALPLVVLGKALGLILRLRPETREVVCMRARGISFEAIARTLGVPVETVKKRHKRALIQIPVLSVLVGRAAVLDHRHGTGDFGHANGL